MTPELIHTTDAGVQYFVVPGLATERGGNFCFDVDPAGRVVNHNDYPALCALRDAGVLTEPVPFAFYYRPGAIRVDTTQ